LEVIILFWWKIWTFTLCLDLEKNYLCGRKSKYQLYLVQGICNDL